MDFTSHTCGRLSMNSVPFFIRLTRESVLVNSAWKINTFLDLIQLSRGLDFNFFAIGRFPNPSSHMWAKLPQNKPALSSILILSSSLGCESSSLSFNQTSCVKCDSSLNEAKCPIYRLPSHACRPTLLYPRPPCHLGVRVLLHLKVDLLVALGLCIRVYFDSYNDSNKYENMPNKGLSYMTKT